MTTAEERPTEPPGGEPALHVVLIHPEIPGNAGNAGRTCLAAGARLHLVRPLGFSLTARRLRRAGLDYWGDVDLEVWDSWNAFAAALPNLGEPYFFTPDAGRSLWDIAFAPRPVLLFGAEGAGLPPDARSAAFGRTVRIPQPAARVRSLNLATCVGIAVYEVLRPRR